MVDKVAVRGHPVVVAVVADLLGEVVGVQEEVVREEVVREVEVQGGRFHLEGRVGVQEVVQEELGVLEVE